MASEDTYADVHRAQLESQKPPRPDDSLVLDVSNAERQRQMFERFGRSYARGEIIFTEGTAGRELCIIQEGQVKLTKSIRGERRVIQTIGAGDFFGEMAILNSKPRSLNAEAATDVKLLTFPPETFQALLVSNTGLALKIIRTLASRLKNADDHIENLLYKDAESKLVNALLKMAEQSGIPEGAGAKLNLSPGELAEQVSLSIDRVKKVMGSLAKSGLVEVQRKAIVIPDLQKLEKALSFLGLRAELGISL